MKPVLFCSILLAFFGFSCKPKPLDNLKEVALKVEENKVKRMSRQQIAAETQRVADSVLVLVIDAQHQLMGIDSACDFELTLPYKQFQKKYEGRFTLVPPGEPLKKLQAELAALRKYRNELSDTDGKFPATFQTLSDSLLYVQAAQPDEITCTKAQAQPASYWVMRVPKQRLIEVKTVKVKPKPKKGPNW